MKKLITYLIITTFLLSVSFPNSSKTNKAYAQNDTVTVLADVVNLREGPGLTYNVIKPVKKDEQLAIINSQGDWYKVQDGDIEGWIASWLVHKNNKSSRDSKQFKGVVVAQIDHLNIRQEPTVSSPMLAQLFTGNEANYLKEQGNWVQIQFGKLTGWVSKDYITIVPAKSSKQDSKEETSSKKEKADQLNYAKVHVDAVNVRKKADLNSKKVDVVYRSNTFKILEEKKGWLQIEYQDGKKGWVNALYVKRTASKKIVNTSSANSVKSKEMITIIYNGTNLREDPSTSSKIVQRVDAGNRFEVIETENDWFKIKLKTGKTAYVANWVVTTDIANTLSENSTKVEKKTNRKKDTLNGLTIVIDAGHGGNDRGTTGKRGTDEKDITLLTAELLKSKLQSAGAKIVMIRESDVYVGLKKRVSISNKAKADAFISIHYDATEDSSISGVTTYYTKSSQKELAQYVHKGLTRKVDLRDRGAQPGNYYVLRENQRNAILIELGFLSNASEERKVTTDYYREQATLGIYQGIVNYFNAQLKE